MLKGRFLLQLLLWLTTITTQSYASSSEFSSQQYKNRTLSAIYTLYANLACDEISNIINSAQAYKPKPNNTMSGGCELNPYVESFYDFKAQGVNGSSVRLILSIGDKDGSGRIRHSQFIELVHSKGLQTEIESINSEFSGEASSDVERSQSQILQQLKSLVYGWSAMLDQVNSSVEIGHMIAQSQLELGLVEATISSKLELQSWLNKRAQLLTESLHRVENLKINKISAGQFRVRFDYDYRDRDRLGMDGLTRLGVEWLVIVLPGKLPVIQKINEQYLPPRLRSISNIEC